MQLFDKPLFFKDIAKPLLREGVDKMTWAVQQVRNNLAAAKELSLKGSVPKEELDPLLKQAMDTEGPLGKVTTYVKKAARTTSSYIAEGAKDFIGYAGYTGTAIAGGTVLTLSSAGAYALARYGHQVWGYVVGAGGGAIGGGLLGAAAAGALSGAAAGTVLPGWGTAIGAIAGAGIGIYCAYKGSQAYDEAQAQSASPAF